MPLRIDPTNLLGLERTIERCQVTSIPAGATPKFIKCKLPGGDGPIVDAWWNGHPSGLLVNDYVELRRSQGNAQYVVIATGGGTAFASNDIPKSIIDAKGDLISATAADTPARLAVGTNGYILSANSATSTGLEWIASSGGGGASNKIINGAVQVWQRGTTFTSIANGAYAADRFFYVKVGTMVHDISRSTDVPTVAGAGVLVPYSLLIDCATADAALASTDVCALRQVIEGYNWADLAQREFTISFWVKATKTGVHCVAFGNSGGDRTYVAEYTINVTDTWEYKTITVSASPTAGAWDYTSGIGIIANWTLAAGSATQTTAGAWQTGNFFGTANQVNACDDAANNFRLTLIDITPGDTAPAIPRIPDFGTELRRCQRYYAKSYAYGTFAGTSTSFVNVSNCEAYTTAAAVTTNCTFPVIMRTTPTVTLYSDLGTINKISTSGGADIGTTVTVSFAGDRGFPFLADSGSGLTANGKYWLHWIAAAEF